MDNLTHNILNSENNRQLLVNIFQKNPDVFNLPYPGYNKPMLHYSVLNGNTNLTSFLIQRCGVDVNCLCKDGQTPLHTATDKIRLRYDSKKLSDLYLCIKLLTETREVDINTVDSEGKTPLHLAVHHGDALAALYVEAGADIEAANIKDDLNRPIHHAAVCSNIDGVKLLLDHGACINARNVYGDNPMLTVISSMCEKVQISDKSNQQNDLKRKVAMVKYLYDNKCSHLCLNNSGVHALCQLCTLKDNILCEIFDIFLDSEHVNKRDSHGFCPIHYAILKPDCSTLITLLDYGCDINARDSFGRTSLHLIPLCFIYLYRNKYGPLYDKYLQKYKELMQELVKYGANVNAVDSTGRQPLHYVAQFGMSEFAELIISENQENVNTADKLGLSPMHIAASRNDVNLLRILLNFGATVEVLDHVGASPLHHACFAKAVESIEFLMKHNSDPWLKDNCGQTAVDIGRNRHSPKSVATIQHHTNNKVDQLVEIESEIEKGVDNLDMVIEKGQDAVNQINNPLMKLFYLSPKEFSQQKDVRDKWKPLCSTQYNLDKLSKVPGVGHVSKEIPEVSQIATAVTSLVEKLVDNVGNLDHRFKGTVIKSGSYFENTKVGDPDEFDFMVNLEYFVESSLKVVLANSHTKVDRIILGKENPSLKEFLMFEEQTGNPYLYGWFVVQKFSVLLGQAISSVLPQLHENLAITYFGGAVRSIVTETTSVNRASNALECVWNGSVYKSLHISIDIVPCFSFSEWPTQAKSSGLITDQMKSLGHHWLPCAQGDPRISFSVAESHILKALPEQWWKAYIYAKMVRGKFICPVIKHIEGALDKFNETDSADYYDAGNVIPSIALKTILFQLADDNIKEINTFTSTDIVNKIYRTLKGNKNIHSFFLHETVMVEESTTGEKKGRKELVLNYIMKYLEKACKEIKDEIN